MVLLGVSIMSHGDLCHDTNSLVVPGKVPFIPGYFGKNWLNMFMEKYPGHFFDDNSLFILNSWKGTFCSRLLWFGLVKCRRIKKYPVYNSFFFYSI